MTGAILGAVGRAVAPSLINAGANMFGAAAGNGAARAATMGNKQQHIDAILDYANQTGVNLEDVYGRNVGQSRQYAAEDARSAQNYGMQNAAFRRGLEADRMRQETFNNMGMNDQQNRANAAASLLDSYNQARNAAIQMATNSLY